MYDKRNEDAYQSRGKYTEPSVCTGCGAIFKNGHWIWGIAELNAHKHLCPTCQRIHDKVPAAMVTMEGEFFQKHQQELLNLVHNTEAKQKSEHPLHRIMHIAIESDQVTIVLADPHLAKAIADALQSAYQGEASMHFAEPDNVMRVHWRK